MDERGLVRGSAGFQRVHVRQQFGVRERLDDRFIRVNGRAAGSAVQRRWGRGRPGGLPVGLGPACPSALARPVLRIVGNGVCRLTCGVSSGFAFGVRGGVESSSVRGRTAVPVPSPALPSMSRDRLRLVSSNRSCADRSSMMTRSIGVPCGHAPASESTSDAADTVCRADSSVPFTAEANAGSLVTKRMSIAPPAYVATPHCSPSPCVRVTGRHNMGRRGRGGHPPGPRPALAAFPVLPFSAVLFSFLRMNAARRGRSARRPYRSHGGWPGGLRLGYSETNRGGADDIWDSSRAFRRRS